MTNSLPKVAARVELCPACHHPAHDPGSCESCPRCELHTDDALEWVIRSDPEMLEERGYVLVVDERERLAGLVESELLQHVNLVLTPERAKAVLAALEAPDDHALADAANEAEASAQANYEREWEARDDPAR